MMVRRSLVLTGWILGLGWLLPTVRAAQEPVRKLYVDNTAGDSVSVIDLGTRRVIHEIHVGRHPHGLGVSPDRRQLYVSVEDTHVVAVIDTATDQIVRTISTTGRPAFRTSSGTKRSRSGRRSRSAW